MDIPSQDVRAKWLERSEWVGTLIESEIDIYVDVRTLAQMPRQLEMIARDAALVLQREHLMVVKDAHSMRLALQHNLRS
jgi:hypothetical protein